MDGGPPGLPPISHILRDGARHAHLPARVPHQAGGEPRAVPLTPRVAAGGPTDSSTRSPPLVAHGSACVPMLFPSGRSTPRPLVKAGHHCDQLAMAASATSAGTRGAALDDQFLGMPSVGALFYNMGGSADGGSVGGDDADRFEIGTSNTFGDRNVGSDPGRSDAWSCSSPVEGSAIPLFSHTSASSSEVAPRHKRRRRTGPNHNGPQTRTDKKIKHQTAAASAAMARANAARARLDDGKEAGRFKADVRLLLVKEWTAFVQKQLGKEGTNLQLSVKNAATYIQKRTATKAGVPHMLTAIQGVFDQVRKYMQVCQNASPTRAGTSDMEDVHEVRDEDKAKAWRMSKKDMAELFNMGEYLLSMTGVTQKTAVVNLGSSGDPDNSVDSSQSTTSGGRSSSSSKCSNSTVGVLPPHLQPSIQPSSLSGALVLSLARSTLSTNPGQPPARRVGASGRSARAVSKADGGGDPHIQQLVSLVDNNRVKDQEQASVALAAVQMQADAAARLDAAAAAQVAKTAAAAARRDAAAAAEAQMRHEKDMKRLKHELAKEKNVVAAVQLKLCADRFRETKDPGVLDLMMGVGRSVSVSGQGMERGTAGTANGSGTPTIAGVVIGGSTSAGTASGGTASGGGSPTIGGGSDRATGQSEHGGDADGVNVA